MKNYNQSAEQKSEILRACLEAIPASVSHVDWIAVGMAMKNELGEAGYSLWNNWSATAPEKYNQRETLSTWNSFQQMPNGKRLGSVIELAKQHGYRREGTMQATAISIDDVLDQSLKTACAQQSQAKPCQVSTGDMSKAVAKALSAEEYWESRGFTADDAKAYNVELLNAPEPSLRIHYPNSDYSVLRLCNPKGNNRRYIFPPRIPQPKLFGDVSEAVNGKVLFVLEGQLDAISLWKAGAQAVAVGGVGNYKAGAEALIKELKSKSLEPSALVLAPDPDAFTLGEPKEQSVLSASSILQEAGYTVHTATLGYSTLKDANDILSKQGIEKLRERIGKREVDALQFKAQQEKERKQAEAEARAQAEAEDEAQRQELAQEKREGELAQQALDDEIRDIIKGTTIGELVCLLSEYTHEGYQPLQLLTAKAMLISALATSGEDPEVKAQWERYERDLANWNRRQARKRKKQEAEAEDEASDVIGWSDPLPDTDRQPQPPAEKRRARLKLTTAGGLNFNLFLLYYAEPSAGKDIASLDESIANELGIDVVSCFTKEGLQDAVIKTPNSYVRCKEFSTLMTPKAKELSDELTDRYDGKSFSVALSRRTLAAMAGAPERKADYCALNFAASVQPAMFERYATPELIGGGLMSRFIIVPFPKLDINPKEDLNTEQLLVIAKDLLAPMRAAKGRVKPPQLYKRFLSDLLPCDEVKQSAMADRYATAYLPKLATWLSFKPDRRIPSYILNGDPIPDEYMQRAARLLKIYYELAKPVLVQAVIGNTKTFAMMATEKHAKKVLSILQQKGIAMTTREVMRKCNYCASQLAEAVKRLTELELIRQEEKTLRLTPRGKAQDIAKLYQ